MCIKLLDIIKRKKYFFMWLSSTLLMMVFYPYVQSLGKVESWLKTINTVNMSLCIIFSAIFGITVMLQIYNNREVRKCHIHAIGENILGVVGFFVNQCPICVSFISLFFLATSILMITTYSIYIFLLAIILLLPTTYIFGGSKGRYED